MSFLSAGVISSYWGKIGTLDMLGDLITSNQVFQISGILNDLDASFTSRLDPRLSLKQLLGKSLDAYYYSLAVQAGCLTFEKASDDPKSSEYKLKIPNLELQNVWSDYIINTVMSEKDKDLDKVFSRIADTEVFNDQLAAFISNQLSYFDFHEQLEKTYHVFIFGMAAALGYKCRSNLESGLGRYALIEAPEFTAIIEFKLSPD
jgi:hypothetical protein